MSNRKAYIYNAPPHLMSFYEGCHSVVTCGEKWCCFTMTIGTAEAEELGVDLLSEELACAILEVLVLGAEVNVKNVKEALYLNIEESLL